MKKKISAVLLCMLILALIFSPSTFAKETVVVEDTFAADDTVNISEHVLGDLYAAGSTVKVDATIDGEAMLFGNIIDVNADINNNVALFGNMMTMADVSARNVRAFGNTITMNDVIANNVYAFGQDVYFSGYAENIIFGGAYVTLDGEINGVGEIEGTYVTVTENAVINDSLTIKSENEIIYEDGASDKNITYELIVEDTETEATHPAFMPSFGFGFNIMSAIINFVYSLFFLYLTAMIIMLLFKKDTEMYVSHIRDKKAIPFLFGLLAAFVIPFAIIIAMITIVGLPLAFAVLLVYIAICILATPFTTLILGRLIFSNMNRFLSLLLATLIMSFVLVIPVINVLVNIAATGCIFGCIVNYTSKKDKDTEPAAEPVVSDDAE